ncbi:hypothetical protein BDB13_3861 [Rhodococcus sp. OK302]|nr:hypothetical protein BDB13_3861 [Rhodococcus sp. OK302]
MGNKKEGDSKESGMDLVVWTESEERELWWRGVLGIGAGARHCVTTDLSEGSH